mgnify:CR=1 FL=1
MRSRCLALVVHASLLLFQVLQAGAGEKAFDIPEPAFFDRVHTVVMLPCSFPRDFEKSDTLAARAAVLKPRLDSIMVATLEEVGVRTISAGEVDSVWQQFADSLGGLYDPMTGESDSTKFAITQLRTMSELGSRYHPDAWILPKVRYVLASFRGGWANWNGVKQRMVGHTSFMKLLTKSGDGNMQGTISALTLYVSFVDMQDQPLYSWGGGLQVTATLKNGKFVDVDPSELFVNREQSDKAVEKALEKLVKYAQKHPKAGS